MCEDHAPTYLLLTIKSLLTLIFHSPCSIRTHENGLLCRICHSTYIGLIYGSFISCCNISYVVRTLLAFFHMLRMYEIHNRAPAILW